MASLHPTGPSESGSEIKSLCMAMLGKDLKRNDEQVNEKVKQTIKVVICKRALSLRAELQKEMKLEEAEEKLKSYVEQLRVSSNLLANINEQMTATRNNKDCYEELQRSKRTTMDGVNRIMDEIGQIEERIEGLKSCWDHFRSNYKDEVRKCILAEIKKKNEKRKNGGAISWEQFLNTIKIEQANGKVIAKKINYFD